MFFFFFIEDESVTRGTSFPVLMAVTDSKQPVVEKVQQLPQLLCSMTKANQAHKDIHLVLFLLLA